QTRNSELLISSVVALAQNLGIHTTAEGIENEAQLRAIRTTRCNRVQGYLLGRPVPASELSAFGSEYTVTATERFVPTALPPRRDSAIGQRVPLGGPVPVTTRVDPLLRLARRNAVTGFREEKVL
ncbi:MAG: EAL domain-containing protein, partial [Acidobacteriota bacterium]